MRLKKMAMVKCRDRPYVVRELSHEKLASDGYHLQYIHPEKPYGNQLQKPMPIYYIYLIVQSHCFLKNISVITGISIIDDCSNVFLFSKDAQIASALYHHTFLFQNSLVSGAALLGNAGRSAKRTRKNLLPFKK